MFFERKKWLTLIVAFTSFFTTLAGIYRQSDKPIFYFYIFPEEASNTYSYKNMGGATSVNRWKKNSHQSTGKV